MSTPHAAGPACLALLLLGPLAPACSSNESPSDAADDAAESAHDADDARRDDADVPREDAEVDAHEAGEEDGDPEDGRTEDGDVEEVFDDGGEDTDDAGGTPLPPGCRQVRPTADNAYAWSSLNSIDAGVFVWRWIDTSVRPSQDVLFAQDLETGGSREVLRRTYPDRIECPAVHGDRVAFFAAPTDPPSDDGKIYSVRLSTGDLQQATVGDRCDLYVVAGTDRFAYWSETSGGLAPRDYRYVDLADHSEHVVGETRDPYSLAFDGSRWIAYRSEAHLYKFDLEDAAAGARLVTDREFNGVGIGFDRDTGVLVLSAYLADGSEISRIEIWDLATDSMTVLVDDPWTQTMPDVDGRVVVYQDSQAAGEPIGIRDLSEVRIIDRDTGVKRVVMPLDTYYGVGIWEHWIALNNYGTWGDALIICDLEAGGFMDADGHVIPE